MAYQCAGEGTRKKRQAPRLCGGRAGLGQLPDTILTRAVVIRMRRRAPHEHVEPYRARIHDPEGKKLGQQLGDRAATITEAMEPIIMLLKVHRKAQETERAAARQMWHDEGRVSAMPDGRPLNPFTGYHEWKALIEEAGLPERRLHDARHTAATVLAILAVPTLNTHYELLKTRCPTRFR